MAKTLRNDLIHTVKEICDVLKISRAMFYKVAGKPGVKVSTGFAQLAFRRRE